MKPYEHVFKKCDYKLSKITRESNPLVILKDDSLLEVVKNDFPNIDFVFEKLKPKATKKQIINLITKYNPKYIITDDKKIYKLNKHTDSFLYKKTKNLKQNKLIVDNSEILEKINNQFKMNYDISIEKDCDILSLIKTAKMNYKKIVLIQNNKINLAIKVGGIWRIHNDEKIQINHLIELKERSMTNGPTKMIPESFSKFSKTNEYISINNGLISYEDNYFQSEEFYNKLNWVASEFYYINTLNNENVNKGAYIYKVDKFELDKDHNYDQIIKKLLKKESISGVDYKECLEISENKYHLKTKFGSFYIEKNNKTIIVISDIFSKQNESDMKIFGEGIVNNIKNNMNNIHAASKITPMKIIQLVLGLAVLFILALLTFNNIFDTENMKFIIDHIFSANSMKLPWIYLIILAFIFSFMMPLWIAFFIEKVVLKKKKLEMTRLWVYFFSSILRRLATFLTGNYFIAVFVWGWYINRKLNIKTSTLIGTISSVSIIRGVLYAFIGTIFMTIGTMTYFLEYNTDTTKSIIVVFIISWLGFLWEIIHNFWMFFLILSPTVQALFSSLMLRIKFLIGRANTNYIESNYHNMVMLNRFKFTMDWKTEKPRIYRTLMFIVVPLFLEGIETVLYFNLVDSLLLIEVGNYNKFKLYWDFISISGLRLAANNIHNFPIINILPGKGMGFSEFGLNTLYEAIFAKQHSSEDLSTLWNGKTPADLSQMTSFVTRFFNQYLPIIITFVISAIILTKESISRKAKV